MASSTAGALPEQSATPSTPLETVILHVLSPSPEVNGGRITFPSIPLNTKISDLKSRISTTVSAPPERQRLIYLGRPLLDMETTLRQALQLELNPPTDQNLTYTMHLIITPARGPTPAMSMSTSQNHAPQNRPIPLPELQAQPPFAGPHHHPHDQQTHVQLPVHPAMAQAQAAQAILQNQLSQLQQQIAMTSMMAQGQGQAHVHRHMPNQPHQMPPFPLGPPNVQAFQAAITQQQQMRAHAGIHGVHNPAMNGIPSGLAFGQNAPTPLGPITTRVHETVGPDGQRTRVVVNETTFQISRQSTPVPATDRTEASQAAAPQIQSSTSSGPQLLPVGLEQRQHGPSAFPPPSLHLNDRQGPLSHLPDFVPQQPAYEPTVSDPGQATSSTTTTAWLLSGPHGPQALVFAPGHGFFTSALPITQPSTRIPRPRDGLRFQQTPSGHIRPQNAPNVAPLPVPDPGLELVIRARNAALAARQANVGANANNDVLPTIMSRIWTFIKLYFVIFMFTEPGTWFRWICLFVAVLVSAMPSTNVFRGFTARLQTHIDGLVVPPAAPAPPVRQQIEGQRQQGDAPADGRRPNSGSRRQDEPDPAATAARLVQEHRQRHPNVLRDTFEWVERGFALFVASLIPGVGERHIRAREEARREHERLERERINAEDEAAARRVERKEKSEMEMSDGYVGGETGEASGDAEKKEHVSEATSTAAGADKQEKGNAVAEEPLIEI